MDTLALLRDQLEREMRRNDRVEAALADAVTAERISAGEASALRSRADQMREWGLLRRLRWALRPR